jgi:hypothetical protein
MEFVSSLVSSLAWPAAVVALVLILRKRLSRALGRLLDGTFLSGFKAGPGGVEGAFGLREAEQDADRAGLPASDDPRVRRVELLPSAAEAREAAGTLGEAQPVTEESLLRVAAASPESAILAAWAGVERELRNRSRRHGVRMTPGEPITRTVDRLVRVGALSSDARELIKDLRRVRNEVAHGTEADFDEAARFVRLARRLVSALQDDDADPPSAGVPAPTK